MQPARSETLIEATVSCYSLRLRAGAYLCCASVLFACFTGIIGSLCRYFGIVVDEYAGFLVIIAAFFVLPWCGVVFGVALFVRERARSGVFLLRATPRTLDAMRPLGRWQARIAWGHIERPGVGVVQTRGGEILELFTQDAGGMRELFRDLGLEPPSVAMSMRIDAPVDHLPAGRLLVVAALAVSLLLAPLWVSAVFFSLVVAIASRRGSVTVGLDGVTIRRVWGRRFVPYADVACVALLASGVVLHLRAGDRAAIPLRARSGMAAHTAERTRRALHGFIDRALGVRAGMHSSEHVVGLLRSQDAAAPSKQMVRAANLGDYRARSVSAEDLERVALDPDLPARQRIAAIVALAEIDCDGALRATRAAVAAAAGDEVRAELEAVLVARR